MPFGIESVDWRQKPNARERTIFLAAMAVFFLGFLKACWFPSRLAISEIKDEIAKAEQEKKVALQMQAAPQQAATPGAPQVSRPLVGVGSIQDVQSAIQKIAQPLLLKGVTLLGVQTSELEREGNMVRQKVELLLSGNFYAVGEYLEAIETLPAAFVIDDFSISLNDDKSGKVMATVKGSFYGMDK